MALLELGDVTKAYGGLVAANGVSFQVEAGSITALIGPNGAGKTTVFDAISGIIPIDSGTIRLGGGDITRMMPHRIAAMGVGRTFQITRELGDLTVLENLAVATVDNRLSSLLRRRMSTDERHRCLEVLEFVGIGALADQPAKRLSYGQKKLLELASILMAEPDLVLLDEPAGGVNPALLERLMERIGVLNGQGITFLIVEHNMDVVMQLSHSVVVMAAGRVVTQGPPAEMRRDQRVLEAYLGEG